MLCAYEMRCLLVFWHDLFMQCLVHTECHALCMIGCVLCFVQGSGLPVLSWSVATKCHLSDRESRIHAFPAHSGRVFRLGRADGRAGGWGCEGVMLVKRCQRLCGLSPMTNRTSASRSENVGSKVLGARSSFHQ